MSINNRKQPRVDSDIPVNISDGETIFEGILRNLSNSGAAIELSNERGNGPVQFELGNAVEMNSEIKDRISGRVVRHYDGGFAVKFDSDEGDLLARMARIVREEE